MNNTEQIGEGDDRENSIIGGRRLEKQTMSTEDWDHANHVMAADPPRPNLISIVQASV